MNQEKHGNLQLDHSDIAGMRNPMYADHNYTKYNLRNSYPEAINRSNEEPRPVVNNHNNYQTVIVPQVRSYDNGF